MKFGALSDIHVGRESDLRRFEKALREFDSFGADAVLCCGDLAHDGFRPQLELVAKAWFGVFPEGRRSDGEKVVNLMHYGDHDMATNYIDGDGLKAWIPDDGKRHAQLLFPLENRRRAWEECFHEPFEQIAYREVKGYPFVLSHFTRGETGNAQGQCVPGLREFLAAHRFDPGKPVFYSQHRVLRNTVGGPSMWGQDGGETTKILGGYPNLIAFCGHKHHGSFDEQCVWQGAFTCVHVPSLRYNQTQGGRENSYDIADRPPKPPFQMMGSFSNRPETNLGYFCWVYDDALVIRRWEFVHDCAMGPDWVIPFSSFALPPEERPFSFARRARETPAPEFPADARVDFVRAGEGKDRGGASHEMVVVSFPVAPRTDATPRANDYEVSLELSVSDVERTIFSKRVYSGRWLHGEKMDTEPVTCLFAIDELPPDRQLRFVVRPVNAFHRKGEPICGRWFKVADLLKRQ